MATVKVNGVELYYEVHGAGEPLLLIMGLGANAANWHAQVPVLSREFQVVAFDNRGAGRSEKPAEAYSIHQMADDAAALMDQLGIQSAHVFGMSMGGMIAQELILHHPMRVRSLVLGGTMAGGPTSVRPEASTIHAFVTLASLPPAQALEVGLSLLYSEEFIAANKPALVKRAIEFSHLMAPPHALQKQAMAVLGFNAHSRLHHVQAPTLILHGTADKIVPYANSAILLDRVPDARLLTYEGAGHGLLVERADEVNAAALDFLRESRTTSSRRSKHRRTTPNAEYAKVAETAKTVTFGEEPHLLQQPRQ